MDKLTEKIIDYEMGTLTESETISFFQELIDAGLAWSLQGRYGRTAHALIKGGYCTENQRRKCQ